jgi:4-amino-4-deoxy-L-arabinose transferase-like glycosyltransferase
LIGHCDQEWNVRIAPALAGLLTVLITTWLAGRLFGRVVAILSGLMLATMYNFLRYSTLAEADIMLAPIVASALSFFAYIELLRVPTEADSNNQVGVRPWCVLGFFVLLGMTNLVKGLVFGTVIAVAPIIVFRLWQAERKYVLYFLALLLWAFVAKKIGLGAAIGMGPLCLFVLCKLMCFTRYVWIWGWLAFAAVALPWPLLVYDRYPDALEVWKYDLVGRLSGNYLGEPAWYYFQCLTWVTQPWSIIAFVGLAVTWRNVWNEGSAAHRFVWCWAWMPILVFSLSDGKHHHYMLHYLAPWAILAAQGTVWTWQKLAERWAIGRPAVVLVGGFACLFLLYSVGFAYKGTYLHRSRDDTAFLFAAREMVPRDQALMINSADEALEGLRMQFYLGDRGIYFLHNLTFVRDERVRSPDIYVVTRYNRLPLLKQYGQVEPMLQCKQARRETSKEDRWTLFHVHLRDDLERKSASVRITPMQAMYREPGPDLDRD